VGGVFARKKKNRLAQNKKLWEKWVKGGIKQRCYIQTASQNEEKTHFNLETIKRGQVHATKTDRGFKIRRNWKSRFHRTRQGWPQ